MWAACKHIGILPPGVKPSWDENGVETQAMILAFYQFQSHDQDMRDAEFIKAGVARVGI